MNTQHLKYVVEVERTGSITQAAENLFMGQPNLSKAIKELEESLGMNIFKRTSKGVTPTRRGAEFLSYAKNILSQVEEMESRFSPASANKTHFSISVPRTSFFAYALTSFMSSFDDVNELDILFRETNACRTANDIDSGEFNLGIVRYQTIYETYFMNLIEEKSLKHHTLWDFGGVVLLSRASHCNDTSAMDSEKLTKYTEVACADTVLPYTKNAIASGRNPRRILVHERASQVDIIRRTPSMFMWSSPMISELLDPYGLVQRKCNIPNNVYKDVLIYRRNYRFTKPDRLYINTLQDLIQTIKEGCEISGLSKINPGEKILLP